MDQVRVTAAILNAIEEFNQNLSAEQRIPESADAQLFGRGGKLDSLGLVNLILTVEEHIERSFGVRLTLASERAMSQEKSPFRSVERLADYVALLLGETTHV